jgi:uncharacterized iron-regulated membrane protein
MIPHMTYWQAWLRRPQTLWLRKAIFQIHLWSGLALALYIIAICLSGSVLVYRNELYQAFTASPVVVQAGPTRLSQEQLEAAIQKAFPGYVIGDLFPGREPNRAVEVELTRGTTVKRRLLNPYTGEDLGNPLTAGFRFTAWLLDFHDNLLGGRTGRRVNGIAATLVIVLGVTGIVIWWPGLRRWWRSASIDFRAGWKQVTWSLHSALGIWFVAFILMWGITGTYLTFPQVFNAVVEYVEPFDELRPTERIGDRVLYWLGYAHFGRFGGRIPGCGRGACHEVFQAVWAVFGLVPVIMAGTGAIMWWNRRGSAMARRAESPVGETHARLRA